MQALFCPSFLLQPLGGRGAWYVGCLLHSSFIFTIGFPHQIRQDVAVARLGLLFLAPAAEGLAPQLPQPRHQVRPAAHMRLVLLQHALAPAAALDVEGVVPIRLVELRERPADVYVVRLQADMDDLGHDGYSTPASSHVASHMWIVTGIHFVGSTSIDFTMDLLWWATAMQDATQSSVMFCTIGRYPVSLCSTVLVLIASPSSAPSGPPAPGRGARRTPYGSTPRGSRPLPRCRFCSGARGAPSGASRPRPRPWSASTHRPGRSCMRGRGAPPGICRRSRCSLVRVPSARRVGLPPERHRDRLYHVAAVVVAEVGLLDDPLDLLPWAELVQQVAAELLAGHLFVALVVELHGRVVRDVVLGGVVVVLVLHPVGHRPLPVERHLPDRPLDQALAPYPVVARARRAACGARRVVHGLRLLRGLGDLLLVVGVLLLGLRDLDLGRRDLRRVVGVVDVYGDADGHGDHDGDQQELRQRDPHVVASSGERHQSSLTCSRAANLTTSMSSSLRCATGSTVMYSS